MKNYSPACERNKNPILEQLRLYLKPNDHVLEVGSCTGQHAAFFAEQLPEVIWQPTDQGDYFPGLKTSLETVSFSNLLPARQLDVTTYDWKDKQYEAVFSANTLHIMSEKTGNLFLSHVALALKSGGKLIIYGPFSYGGQFTSDSNAEFDRFLKSNNPKQGIRDFHKINAELIQQGFVLLQDQPMPAHNQCVVWEYRAP